jgi:hypothetical protein
MGLSLSNETARENDSARFVAEHQTASMATPQLVQSSAAAREIFGQATGREEPHVAL